MRRARARARARARFGILRLCYALYRLCKSIESIVWHRRLFSFLLMEGAGGERKGSGIVSIHKLCSVNYSCARLPESI